MGSTGQTLQETIANARFVVDGTLADVTPEVCAKLPGGEAHSIAANYAHMVIGEDVVVNMIIRGSAPLLMSAFAGKAGISEPPPPPGSTPEQNLAWANSVKIDIPALKEYDNAVRAATDEYVAGASDEELARKINVPAFGGEFTASGLIGIIAVIHRASHTGEISSLKGMWGGKGYPF